MTLNNQLVADGLRYSIGQCDAKLLVVDRLWVDARSQYLDDRQAAMPRIVIESDAEFLAALADFKEAEPVHVGEDRPCSILYTSGTTGLPKGVVNSHGAYLACGKATVQALNVAAMHPSPARTSRRLLSPRHVRIVHHGRGSPAALARPTQKALQDAIKPDA